MATRSNAPVETAPAIGALGQEAIVAAALALPQIPEQIAALPDPALSADPSAPDQLAALLPGTTGPTGDAAPQLAAADPVGQTGFPDVAATALPTDLAPLMGAVPPATTE